MPGTGGARGWTLINRALLGRRYGYALASFLFASTPLPSNMLFVAYGLMRARGVGLYAGFWCGRMLSYYVMITASGVVLVPFLQLFEDRYIGILVADAAGVGTVFLFACIDWKALVTERAAAPHKAPAVAGVTANPATSSSPAIREQTRVRRMCW